jgi:hypothetical protein
MKEVTEESLKQVMQGILEVANKEREESQPYKDLFGLTKENSITGALRDVEHKMTSLALDICHILETKYDIKVTNEKFGLLLALPFVLDRLEKDISAKEGHMCCVDKAFHLVNKILLDL